MLLIMLLISFSFFFINNGQTFAEGTPGNFQYLLWYFFGWLGGWGGGGGATTINLTQIFVWSTEKKLHLDLRYYWEFF